VAQHARIAARGQQAVVVPHPLRSGLPLFALASLALILWAAGVEGPWLAAALAGGIGVAGTARVLLGQHRLRGLRHEADIQLSTYRFPPDTALATWRRGELSGMRRRKLLAASIERVGRAASETRLPGASPINRVAVRRYEHLLPVLADRLRAEGEVSATGLLMIENLLRNPDSPLYARERENELGLTLTRCLAALAREKR
jgi:hypothetical protein